MISMDRLRRRADFLAAAAGPRASARAFLLQGRDRRDRGPARVGYTVTKKTGSAVERNRIRRRLRAATCEVMPRLGKQGFDYVVVAGRAAIEMPYSVLIRDLEQAIIRLHAGRKATGGGADG